ncbi:MAG: alkyl sulfatase dimerization domain-containing protein [Candidatus Hodarchaeales archaeon]|jgi:alkyl sulfatase BDS1-like metallo-beta-lactamase superfamily hydrolase
MNEIKPTRVLGAPKARFTNPIKDVHTAVLPIAGCAWVETTEGVVLIDAIARVDVGKEVFKKINGTIKYIIYTHGHTDHTGGTAAYLEDNPEIIASEFLPDRLDKYKMLAPHRAHITAVQFNIPEFARTPEFVYPTKTFLGDMTIKLGDKTFELHAVRAETDDAVWVYIPELKAAFIGDLIIAGLPNVGNPWKPTRFALDWAKALEDVRALNPEHLFCNGAGFYYTGEKALKILDLNIASIRNLHDQVVDHINRGTHISEMIHEIKLPDHLAKDPYLRPLYSRTEFFVFNVYRQYHGYFDDNPAHLLPRPEKEVMGELYKLIGNPNKILSRVKELLESDQAQLAIEVLDVLIQANPENIEARKLRIDLLKNLAAEDYCLMSRNAWVHYINKDKEFLKSKKQL